MSTHIIEEVRFSQAAAQGRPESEAPLLCRCGVVTTSGQWEAHRGPTTTAERNRRNTARRNAQ